jgi:hypothetical protein
MEPPLALVYDSRWRALDASGNPIVGATLTVYTAGTTTPASIWRDSGLSVAMSNPTSGADKSDSAGRFPQIYAADSATFDVLLKDAAGVTLASYLSVIALGTSDTTFVRNFTNSRLQARGSGGTVYIEAGDPSGDDIGGTMRLGGWNGTQADLVTVDTAQFNTTGQIKQGGYKLAGIVRYEDITFTTVSSAPIPLINEPTGVRVWDIDIIDLVMSLAGAALEFLLSYDGGATYVTTATYSSAVNASFATTNSPTGGAGGTNVAIGINVHQVANVPGSASIRVITANSGSFATQVFGQVNLWENSTTVPKVHTFAAWESTGGRATHLLLLPSGGTISGIYRLRPQLGFGET